MSSIEAAKNPRDIILRPVVTEKSSILMDQAIEAIFGVKVASVATQNRKGKVYRTRNGIGTRKDVKRAIVTLREGTIDIFGEQA